VERLADALDFAHALGLLKYAAPGRLAHAPFTLHPAPVDSASLAELEALTVPAARLALATGHDAAFLADALGEAARVDEFTAWLMALSREVPAGSAQPHELLISRNDFFLQRAPSSSSSGASAIQLRQVEFNAIAASYPGLSGLTQRLHAILWPERKPRLVANDPLAGVVAGIAEGVRRFGRPGAIVVMIVQPDETNVFDQRLVEIDLAESGIGLRRMSLEDVAREGSLREGHLTVGGHTCAVAYLRAGYAPADLATPAARKGRTLLEHSDAIVIPRVGLQLAGAKKVQQVLADPAVLGRFVDAATSARLRATFAGLYGLEDPVTAAGASLPAWQAAIAAPERFVLKPQREGGGNNLYDEDIPLALRDTTARERAGYILMERIHPLPHASVLVRDGVAHEAVCVSEIGRFGVLLAERDRIHVNQDIGYLVRTREQHLREGGVSAGFGHLSSLELVDDAQ
jgi:glutathione synthase